MTTTLITGANKGLGFETARRLVAAGHTVYVGSRDAERGRRAAEQLGARVVQLDVTDDASVEAAAKTIEADGGLDVLINNAGIEERGDGNVVIGAADVTADMMRNDVRDERLRHGARHRTRSCRCCERSAAPVVVNVSSGLASLTRITAPGTPTSASRRPEVPVPADRAPSDTGPTNVYPNLFAFALIAARRAGTAAAPVGETQTRGAAGVA